MTRRDPAEPAPRARGERHGGSRREDGPHDSRRRAGARRVCLVVHGLPPHERTGVENYTAELAAALGRAGHVVEVFAPRVAPLLPNLSLRRERREGYAVDWLTTNQPPRDPVEMLDLPGVAERFGEFLDGERPEVVHFQHVLKLGVGLIEEARSRGIPTVYTAHDYWPVCHRITLMRPDVERCETIGEPAVCARCDLALAVLNRIEELGDYHVGAFAAELDEASARALEATLAGDERASGFPAEEWESARERRAALDLRRSEELAKLDLVLAPTAHLRDRLVEGGVARGRIEVLGYGIATGALETVPAPRSPREGRLRFGFLGGLAKHKGVHVLLDAFESVEADVELHVFGGSSDSAYVERMRARAAEVGARWHGQFEHHDVARALARVDVVVVPSIWIENQPIVIREAFASGRPVIASDVGAVPESVRDGVDGLLVAPGDPEALAGAMRRVATEDGLFERLAAGIGPVKDLDAQVAELAERYDRLVADRAAMEQDALPAHLRPIARLHRELDALPSRDLFRRVLRGLSSLRHAIPGAQPGESPEDLIESALTRGSEAQVLLRDLRRSGEWMKRSLSSHEETVEALQERLGWREEELRARSEEIEWLGRGLADAREAREALERERDWLAETLRARDEELGWLRESVENLERALASVRAELEESRRGVEALREESRWLASEVAGRDEELHWLRGELVKHEERTSADRARFRERLAKTAEVGLAALRTKDWVVTTELRPLLEALDAAEPLEAAAPGEAGSNGGEDPLEGLARSVRLGVERLRRLEEELRWRREEMVAARSAYDRRLARAILRTTGVGRRISAWRLEDGDADGEDGG